MISDKAAFFQASLKRKTIAVDALGGEQIEIRELGLRARDEISGAAKEKDGELLAVPLIAVRHGVPVLADATDDELRDSVGLAALNEIATAVFAISGVTEGSMERAEKKSESATTDDSNTG